MLMLPRLGTALKDTPEVKTAVVALIKAAEAVDVDAVGAIAAKGIDLPEDLKAIADVQAFFALFKKSFVPTVEAAYKDVEADTEVEEEVIFRLRDTLLRYRVFSVWSLIKVSNPNICTTVRRNK